MGTVSDYPLVAIIVIYYKGRKLIDDCIDSLYKTIYPNLSINIVNNNEKEKDFLKTLKAKFINLNVINSPSNVGYSKGINVGVQNTNSDYVVILNSDTRVFPDWLNYPIEFLEGNSQFAAINPTFLSLENPKEFQLKPRNFERYSKIIKQDNYSCYDVRVLYGACLIVRRKYLTGIYKFDSKFFMYFEEIDWCWRLRLFGLKLGYIPQSKICHQQGGSETPSSNVIYLNTRNFLLTTIKNTNFFLLLMVIPINLIFRTLVSLLPKKISKRKREDSRKIRILLYCLAIKNVIKVRKEYIIKRKLIQKHRIQSDKDLKLANIYHSKPYFFNGL